MVLFVQFVLARRRRSTWTSRFRDAADISLQERGEVLAGVGAVAAERRPDGQDHSVERGHLAHSFREGPNVRRLFSR